jgi:hypothetical protein
MVAQATSAAVRDKSLKKGGVPIHSTVHGALKT